MSSSDQPNDERPVETRTGSRFLNLFSNPEDSPKQKAKRLVGIASLLGVVVLWVGSSILMQYIFIGNDYNKPFFTTYLDTSMFTIYLLGFIIRRKVWLAQSQSMPKSAVESDSAALLKDTEEPPSTKMTIKETIKLALIFCPIWFIDNYTFNLSLTMTSVSSNTILSSTSSLWTLILSVLIGAETFGFLKLFGVLLTFGGVILVSMSDSSSREGETVWGDILALISAMTYAIYVSLYKKLVKDEERVNNSMFLGFMGFFNMIMLWPFIAVWDVAKWEPFEVPKGLLVLYLILNSLLGTALSDYLWLVAVLLLSPVIATVGLSLTIPVAMVSDMIIQRTSFHGLYIFGAVLVAIGFVVVNTGKSVESRVRKFLCGFFAKPQQERID